MSSASSTTGDFVTSAEVKVAVDRELEFALTYEVFVACVKLSPTKLVTTASVEINCSTPALITTLPAHVRCIRQK